MQTGRIALVSVYLCLVRLLALPPPPPQQKLCSKDIVKNVEYLIASDPNSKCSDCRLYTPTVAEYEKCPGSTMKCFADEFKVLIEEWETIPMKGFRLDRKLGKHAQWLNQSESGCLQCELLKEETARQFLTDLLSTVQMMNSQNCPNRTL